MEKNNLVGNLPIQNWLRELNPQAIKITYFHFKGVLPRIEE